jgi:hypothetical protein
MPWFVLQTFIDFVHQILVFKGKNMGSLFHNYSFQAIVNTIYAKIGSTCCIKSNAT